MFIIFINFVPPLEFFNLFLLSFCNKKMNISMPKINHLEKCRLAVKSFLNIGIDF